MQLAQVQVEGPEASAFLQRQCTSDLRLLGVDGDAQWSALLSPKGRVLHLFRLLRVTCDRFLLLAAGDQSERLAQTLQRFVLRSKLKVTPVPGPLQAAIGPSAPESGAWLRWDEGRWIAPGTPPVEDAADIDAAWQHLDTLRGIPRVYDTLSDRFTPQMLSLQALQAFSLSKGCYPGQEIVARTHYLGQQKRSLASVQADRAMQPGDSLQSEGRSLGEVIQVSRQVPGVALAVVSQEAIGTDLRLSDGTAILLRDSPVAE